jgi:hypothetical protein
MQPKDVGPCTLNVAKAASQIEQLRRLAARNCHEKQFFELHPDLCLHREITR